MLTRSDRLSEEFARWEWRGRGWRDWGRPVPVEPPFLPFPGYGVERRAAVPDDGRRPTLLSSLLRRAAARLAPEPAPEPPAEEDGGEEPPEEEARERVVEIRALAPPDMPLSFEEHARLFAGLASCEHPVSFELVADAEAVRAQVAVSPDDAERALRQLSAFFPDAEFVPRRGSLAEAWRALPLDRAAAADLALAREFLLPLPKPPGEPLVPLVAALSGLRKGEMAVFQVLFGPARRPWAPSMERLATDAAGKPLFVNAPELAAGALRKGSGPLYAAVARVAACGASHERSCEIVAEAAAAVCAPGERDGNELVPLPWEPYPIDRYEDDVPLRRTRRSGMLLGGDELSWLARLPSREVRSPKLERRTKRTKRAPDICLGHPTALGVNAHAGEEVEATLSHDQRTRHVYVVGASGTGKSTLLLSLIMQDIRAGEGVAVIDPHGDLVDAVLARMPEGRAGDVALIDPSDEAFPVAFNILTAHSDLERSLLASDLVAVFRRLSSAWGDQLNSVLANAILAFLESDRGGTLLDLRRFLVEPAFRAEFLETVRDPEVAYYWRREFPMLSGKPQGPVLTRLDMFLRPKSVRNMVAQREGKLDFAAIMNGRKILLAKLAQGAIGEENAALLGSLVVGKLQQTAISRQAMREEDRAHFWVYADEFHHYATPSMATILSGARKYRLGLTLANQELRQVEARDREVASAALSNPYARVCFRVGDADARSLAAGFASFDARDLLNLGVGEAICRVERAEYDFNIAVPPIPPVEEGEARRAAARAIEASRRAYATPREEVEAARAAATPAAPAPKAPPAAEQPKPVEPQKPVAQKFEPPKPLPPPAKAAPEPVAKPAVPAATPGRGGKRHKYLQQLIKSWAEGLGWRAVVEAPAGAGSADVLLSKGDTSVACEITMTTGAEHELANLKKCLAAGFGCVVSVCEGAKRAAEMGKAARAAFAEADLARLRFLTVDGLFALVEELDAKSRGTEGTVKGIKVKVAYKPLSPEEAKARKERLAQVVAKALKKNGGK